jgi:hypothetical protein
VGEDHRGVVKKRKQGAWAVTGSITSGLVLSGEERLSFSEKISEAEL